jgi:hypothetical protein
MPSKVNPQNASRNNAKSISHLYFIRVRVGGKPHPL